MCFSRWRFVFSFHVFLLDCHTAFEFDHNAVVLDVYLVDKHFHGCAINRGKRITLHRLLYEGKPADGRDYIQILGRVSGKRIYKYIRRDYVKDVENLDYYKVYVAQANGSGEFGETMSEPVVEGPGVGATETFLSIGKFNTMEEAHAVEKYIKTKFARALLSVLKVTQNGNKPVWKMIPLQNFTPDSDIDWSKSIHDIDLQLYRKYGLDEKEIEFIESHVKEMA